MIQVIADDLTGACECSALGLRHGLRCVVLPDPGQEPGNAELVAWNTDSRHVDPGTAARRVGALVRPHGLVYKKTDSALRGNIAAELAALRQARPHAQLIYAPAYPSAGRVVIAGRLRIDGVPVEDSAFARDPLCPVRDGDVRRLVPGRHLDLAGLRCGRLPADPVVVVDGEDDLDLARLADLCEGRDIVAAGPAGFLSHLLARRGSACLAGVVPAPANWLVVAGSQHPRTLEQVRHLVARGVPAVTLDPAWIASDAPVPAVTTPAVLRTATVSADVARYRAAGIDPHRLTARLAEAAATIARVTGCDLAVCGGDTALAIVRQLGIRSLEPIEELAPGAVICQAGSRLFLTKNGGFGQPDLLARLL